MDTVPRIRAARWADKDPAATLVADALHLSPLATWLVPDAPQRRRILADVLGIWVEHAMFFGDIYVTDDLTAAAVGFHRYRPIPPPVNYPIRLSDAAGPYAGRFDLLDELLSAQRPTEPHYHLALLAVRPDVQRCGRGKAMLAHHRSRLDRVGLPAWTDTTAVAVRDLYARYGYTPRPSIAVPDGPCVWPMRCDHATAASHGPSTRPDPRRHPAPTTSPHDRPGP